MVKVKTKSIHVKNGDVLVIRRMGMTTDQMNHMVKKIESSIQGPGKICCIFVDQLSDIKKLSNEQMERYGWTKKE